MEQEHLTENVREQMLGLLPFDNDAVDIFIPKEYSKLPSLFQPIFYLKPWNQSEKEQSLVIIEKLEKTTTQNEKIKINQELNELTRKKIVKIERLYDVGKKEFINCQENNDSENDCISSIVWAKIPDTIKSTLYFRISTISGLIKNEVLGL